MKNKTTLVFSHVRWHIIAAYFLAVFLALVAMIVVVVALVYIHAAPNLPHDVLQTVMDKVMVRLVLILGVLVILGGVGSWFLARIIAARRELKLQTDIDAQLLDVANDSIFVHDLKGNCLYANETAYKSRGYDQIELKVLRFPALEVPESAKLNEARTKELLEKGELIFESAHLRKGKPPMLVEVHSRVVGSNGRRFIITSVRDITERKRTEEELREASEKLQRAMEGTIHAMAVTAEIRDPYTAGHQQRVAKLATAIAREMDLPEEQVEGIRVAGILHDIGKTYVPAEILSKPGILRKNEMSLVKDHAEVGYDLLKTVEFSWPVAQIVFQHHERMDGSGYPRGLSGEDVMIEARIMGVADVIEAMASHRPYRPAFSTEKALLEIIQKKGILYDAQVVDACLKLFNEKQFSFD
ncbi:MAG: HD domain-containing protein [Chloroflexi bacterium]|nr:HD domain-containing protein [Chloroflexota bacterium]